MHLRTEQEVFIISPRESGCLLEAGIPISRAAGAARCGMAQSALCFAVREAALSIPFYFLEATVTRVSLFRLGLISPPVFTTHKRVTFDLLGEFSWCLGFACVLVLTNTTLHVHFAIGKSCKSVIYNKLTPHPGLERRFLANGWRQLGDGGRLVIDSDGRAVERGAGTRGRLHHPVSNYLFNSVHSSWWRR